MLSPVSAASSVSVGVECLANPNSQKNDATITALPLLVSFYKTFTPLPAAWQATNLCSWIQSAPDWLPWNAVRLAAGLFHQLTQSSTARPKTL
jgi:hypothetical protein